MGKIQTTRHNPTFSRLPKEFDGFCIAHVTDLHNRDFGGRLEEKIAWEKPDIIVITGDSIHIDGQYSHALKTTQNLAGIAPTYYVSGNHESVLSCYGEFAEKMRAAGVRVMDNETEILERGEDKIVLIGMSDPAFFTAPEGGVRKDAFKSALDGILTQNLKDSESFRILLCHRPELHEYYVSRDIDITFTGHAHGGQVRFPFIGALYAPNQGLFPRYTCGMKRRGEKYTVISRGLGKSNPVPRIFNPPELVIVKLRAAHTQTDFSI